MTPRTTDPQQEAILDAAERLFEQFGYRKTTVEEIAAEARIGKGSVYLHFESKEALGLSWLARLHRRVMDELETIASAPEPPLLRIRSILMQRVLLRYDVSVRHRRSMDEALATLRCEVRNRREAFHLQEAELLRRLICEAIEGSEARTATPFEDALSMICATNSLLPYSLRPDEIGDRETLEAKVGGLSNLLVRAIAKQ